MLNLASIHTTLIVVIHLLYDLVSHPEYIDPLRAEINSLIDAHGGLTLQAINMMDKLDSCIKETLRLNSLTFLVMDRVALKKDYTFTSGRNPFTLPKGILVGLPSNAVGVSQEIYGTDAGEWKGFRFSELRKGLDAAESAKYQAVSTSSEFLAFGHGVYACPGRVFAVMDLKVILCHLLLNFDIRFPAERGGKRPQNTNFSGMAIADLSAELEFKRRKL